MQPAHDGGMDLGHALTIIQMDYVEMPGLTLTPTQGRRLWTLPADVCHAALETLAATGFLVRDKDGRYVRSGAARRDARPAHLGDQSNGGLTGSTREAIRENWHALSYFSTFRR